MPLLVNQQTLAEGESVSSRTWTVVVVIDSIACVRCLGILQWNGRGRQLVDVSAASLRAHVVDVVLVVQHRLQESRSVGNERRRRQRLSFSFSIRDLHSDERSKSSSPADDGQAARVIVRLESNHCRANRRIKASDTVSSSDDVHRDEKFQVNHKIINPSRTIE